MAQRKNHPTLGGDETKTTIDRVAMQQKADCHCIKQALTHPASCEVKSFDAASTNQNRTSAAYRQA